MRKFCRIMLKIGGNRRKKRLCRNMRDNADYIIPPFIQHNDIIQSHPSRKCVFVRAGGGGLCGWCAARFTPHRHHAPPPTAVRPAPGAYLWLDHPAFETNHENFLRRDGDGDGGAGWQIRWMHSPLIRFLRRGGGAMVPYKGPYTLWVLKVCHEYETRAGAV